MLKDEADAALLDRHLSGILVTEENAPVVGQFQAGDNPKERRLAGAGQGPRSAINSPERTDRLTSFSAAVSANILGEDVDANVHAVS